MKMNVPFLFPLICSYNKPRFPDSTKQRKRSFVVVEYSLSASREGGNRFVDVVCSLELRAKGGRDGGKQTPLVKESEQDEIKMSWDDTTVRRGKAGRMGITPCFCDCFHVLSRVGNLGCASGVWFGNLVCTPVLYASVCLFAGVTVTGKWVCESEVFRWSWECRGRWRSRPQDHRHDCT